MSKRGETWGFKETNVLLDTWADEKVQANLNDNPKRNIKIYTELAKKCKEIMPEFERSAEEVRAKLKRLKAQYFKVKQQKNKSGEGSNNWPFWQKMNNVLGPRPISTPVAIVNTMDSESSPKDGKLSYFFLAYINFISILYLHFVKLDMFFLFQKTCIFDYTFFN